MKIESFDRQKLSQGNINYIRKYQEYFITYIPQILFANANTSDNSVYMYNLMPCVVFSFSIISTQFTIH